MNLYLLFLILLSFIGIKINIKAFNHDYMSKKCTTCINGIFILIVFYSHIVTFIDVQYSKDFLMFGFRNLLGQLMVTTFLFYSGYGLYYQINKKKDKYINSLPIKRILKTMLKFFVAVLSFVLVNILLHKSLSISKVLLSFIAWDSIGNSNWYIFSIIFMYLLTFISFKLIKNHKGAILLNTVLIILFIMFLSIYKEDYWYNTLLCYLFGLLYGYKKDSVDKVLFNNFNYLISLIIVAISFILFRHYASMNYWYYELYSVIFVMLIILITMKFKVNNKVLEWFGKNLFWIYILQRIPMIVFKKLGYATHSYRYFLLAFVSTIVLTVIYSSLFDKWIDKFTTFLNSKVQKRFF